MDKFSSHPPLTDAEINALIDGQVHGAERAALQERLQHDEAARERLANWQTQRGALQGLHRELLDAPLPAALHEAAHRMNGSHQRIVGWQRWGGLAASVVLAFSAGWLGRGHWPPASGLHSNTLAALPTFARDAAVAHAVYSPETRHPVEVSAAEQAHLVQWLSRRIGKTLKVPELQAQGYSLVGGRLLPGDAGARAQFMFQNTQGVRVTLYLGALDPALPDLKNATRETAFRFTQDGPVPGFYWVADGFGYALSGPLTREALMALADAVYHQL
ncbi:MAG: anti-sigma factor family protein [Hydrogenophaga sp.]|jgi:anti-sigma factor RsiW|uniref:anti-sigma factor family protein n=1 Tax=Hydrogenophaga sp. TaxID=1904254 RepID=UPI001DC4890C|nr:anti-sigma factor [Hydrogenophaga sp.]MBW0172052.1 anti-sigma factor [Hydrogenophaga sp.]MBW0182614.1 anti-sigma factor [Hydrogenophaga sp.]